MIAGKELLASSTSPIAIAHALGWPRCLKDFVYPTPSKAPEFNAAIDDQGESSLEPEKQLALWQGEIAREAQQGRGIDALQRVLSKLRKNSGRMRHSCSAQSTTYSNALFVIYQGTTRPK